VRKLLLVAAAILLGCCTNTFGADGEPALFVWKDPVYLNSESAAGLIIEVWQDGNVVRARGPEWVGFSAVRGHISRSSVEAILSLASEKSLASKCKQTRLHAASISLTVRHGSDVGHFSCEVDSTQRLQDLIWSIEIVDPKPITNREAKSLFPEED